MESEHGGRNNAGAGEERAVAGAASPKNRRRISPVAHGVAKLHYVQTTGKKKETDLLLPDNGNPVLSGWWLQQDTGVGAIKAVRCVGWHPTATPQPDG